MQYQALNDIKGGWHSKEEVEQLFEYFSKDDNPYLAAYLFQIETGMAIADLMDFEADQHIVQNIDGQPEIQKRRSKYRDDSSLETVFIVELSRRAQSILKTHCQEGKFDYISTYQSYRHHLRTLSDKVRSIFGSPQAPAHLWYIASRGGVHAYQRTKDDGA